MKTLILITNSFPFGIAEKSFIKPELEILKKKFNVVIVTRNIKDEQTTEIDKIPVYRYDRKFNYNIITLLLISLFQKDFYKDLLICWKKGRLNIHNIKTDLSTMMRVRHFSKFLKKVRSDIKAENVMYYTYWNDYATYACTKVREENDIVVSRIHRADLYLTNNHNWLPYKYIINKNIDALYFISEEGKNYYIEHYNKIPDKMKVCYLGVKKQEKMAPFKPSKKLRLLSFSYISAVKRVNLLIDVLEEIEHIQIEWIHIGGGILEDKIKKEARDRLGKKKNISYRFMGYMQNEKAIEFVSFNEFDFLVNVSYSEGLPVTMMEAMSLGIPVIGTDVGGVSEIISNGENGFLIKRDFKTDDLINVFDRYIRMSDEKKYGLRKKAVITWHNKFYDKNNYTMFSEELEDLYENQTIHMPRNL